jgi:hypothetical protein
MSNQPISQLFIPSNFLKGQWTAFIKLYWTVTIISPFFILAAWKLITVWGEEVGKKT